MAGDGEQSPRLEELREKIRSLEMLRADLGDDLTDRKIAELRAKLQTLIGTDGGAVVEGSVNTDGGQFVGRDMSTATRDGLAISANVEHSIINVTVVAERMQAALGVPIHTDLPRATESYLNYLLDRYPGNKFVLTSRIVGYREVRPATRGLGECVLVDFDDGEIVRFIECWTMVIERQAQGTTHFAQAEAELERNELLNAVRRNPGVRYLASNPLLLTVLVLMKRQGVALPERRIELYEQYVKTLLSSWNRARGLGRSPQEAR